MTRAAEIADLAMEAGAAQKRAELEAFVDQLLYRDIRTVLEIGTMDGGTLRAWCECASHNALIASIDLPGGPWGGGYDGHREALIGTFAQPGQNLCLIKGDSRDPEVRAKVELLLGARKLDLLFIDGDHSYEGVKADFESYSPLVAKGGLVALHDVLEHPQEPTVQVAPFWREIRERFEKTWEFAVDGDERTWGPWGGIGAVEL